MYVHGGLEHATPNNLISSEICKIDAEKLFEKHENLLEKIKNETESDDESIVSLELDSSSVNVSE